MPLKNPWRQPEAIARDLNQIGRQYRQESPAGSFPNPVAVGPRAVVPRTAPPPPVPAPVTAEAATDQLVAEARKQTALLQKIAAQNDLILRMNWLNFSSNTAISPTNPELPILGSAGNNYTGAVYQAFYRNIREYPIGVIVTARWTTPGAWLLLSTTTGDNGLIAELQNGGPNGGVITGSILLNPGQTLFAANKDAGVPIAATDIFRVRVQDVANYLKQDVFRTMPYSLK